MTIEPGTRLGPYEIVASIGAGGMGEVWRARDTRLDRDVAIKVLPAGFAENEQLLQRFEREAKAISQLNHPNVCTLFDVGKEEARDERRETSQDEDPSSLASRPSPLHYLVMEYLEGESLADRLKRGPLPVHEVLKYGQQIASALDAAHRQGITHRDLKPGNIMLTKSGAKLLDFGLAKTAAEGPTPIDGLTNFPTEAKPLTQEGTILGTFQYMAPEQLEGLEADARTDIFALGAVLYEMATGHRAFQGSTKTSLIAAIVSSQPTPISSVIAMTPPALDHVVRRCLEKDPDDRWQSAHDVASELQWISEAGSQAGVVQPLTRTRARRSRIVTIFAAVGWAIAIAAIVSAVMIASRLSDASRVTSTDLADQIAVVWDAPLAVSPDGQKVAIEIPGTSTRLSIRDLGTGETKVLTGTEGATFPFWAPDGHAIGFFADGKLRTVNADTGAIQTICDAPAGRGGSWSSQGVIVFAPNIANPIMKVGESGGTPVPVTTLGFPTDTHRNPTFLPNGKNFLYCVGDAKSVSGSLHVGSIDGGFDRKVLDYASSTGFIDGWLLTTRDGNLMAQRFDPDALAVEGRPVAIAQNIGWYAFRWLGTFSAGANTLVYQHAAQPRRQLLVLDEGATRPVSVGDEANMSSVSASSDGRRAIVGRFDPTTTSWDLWMIDLGGGKSTRVTFNSSDLSSGLGEASALFSPDGELVALTGDSEAGILRAWIQPAGGGSKEELLADSDFVWIGLSDWSSDGRSMLISPQRPGTGVDVELIHLDGDRKPVPLIDGPADESEARFSPNGRWIAYQSTESGRPEVYVTDNPGATAKWQVSTEGGGNPWWSRDGKILYYLAGGRVLAATVHEETSFTVDSAKPVEALDDRIYWFTVARNGRIVALRENDAGESPLTIVRNWQTLLREK